jgi:hypothetical protein
MFGQEKYDNEVHSTTTDSEAEDYCLSVVSVQKNFFQNFVTLLPPPSFLENGER